MKKILTFAILLLAGFASQAQYYYYRTNAPVWKGPVRGYLGGGLVQRSGIPDFKEYAGDALHPDEFSATTNFNVSLGVDFETAREGFAVGPYFHLDYFTDGWTARFHNELPVSPNGFTFYTYDPLNDYEYTMTCSYLSGTFGAGAYYHFGEYLEIGIGAGLYLMHALSTSYSSNTYLHATGAELPYHDEAPEILESTAVANPMHVGLEGKVDINYFISENFYIGLQARYDMALWHCSIDDSPNLMGASMQCSDNNRPRMAAMVTIGSYLN